MKNFPEWMLDAQKGVSIAWKKRREGLEKTGKRVTMVDRSIFLGDYYTLARGKAISEGKARERVIPKWLRASGDGG